MPRITYIQPDGTEQCVEAAIGVSVMHAALASGVPGILAECGGAASCATCHVYVDAAFSERVGPCGEDEDAMLDCTASERTPFSRLSCQIEMSEDLDGVIVRLPEAQA